MKSFLFTALLLFSVSAWATENLSTRMSRLHIQADQLFYSPETSEEKTMFNTGLYHHWQSYGKSSEPDAKQFTGYILFSDPFHEGLNKVSFLLGSDCSHFVHRLFQVMGLNFPYAKTRHWIHLYKFQSQVAGKSAENYYQDQSKSGLPIDLSLCEWLELNQKFDWISETDPGKLQVGDFLIFPKDQGILGEKGHVGVVSKPGVLLQAKYPNGIVELPITTEKNFFVVRWKGPLSPLKETSLKELLSHNYPFETSTCREPKHSHVK